MSNFPKKPIDVFIETRMKDHGETRIQAFMLFKKTVASIMKRQKELTKPVSAY